MGVWGLGVLNNVGIKISRAILDGCLDRKLATRLRNHTNDAGVNDVKDDTSIDQCLKTLNGMFLDDEMVVSESYIVVVVLLSSSLSSSILAFTREDYKKPS